MASILAIGVGWANEIVLSWSGNNLSDSNNALAVDAILTNDAFYNGPTDLVSCTAANNVYVAADGLKLGKSKEAGTLSFSFSGFSGDLKPTKITVSAKKFGSDTGKLTITAGEKSVSQSPTTNYGDIELEMDGNTALSTLTLATSSKRAYIKSITIVYGVAAQVATPTFTPGAGSYYEAQSVTLSCATEGADIFWGYDGESFVTYDGDPILVNKTMTLYAYAMKGGMENSEVASAAYTITGIPTVTPPYEEGFAGNLGQFYVNNVVNPGFDVWNAGSYSGITFAKASGYSGGAKDSESWLISPYINLTDANAPQLSFSQAIDNHFGTIANEATLWVKEKLASDWTQLTITYPETPESGYTEFEAQTIDLTAYKGKIIQIAFKYVSTEDAAGNWEVANIKVDEKPLEKAYYLTGSFNGWGDSDNPKFTKLDENTYVLRDQAISAGTEFKLKNEVDAWLGGGSQTVNITKDSFRNLALNENQSANFCIPTAGTYDFVVKIKDGVATLTVPQTTDLYLKGSFDGWTDGDKFTRNEDGSYTLAEKVLSTESEFKIYDADDAWYSGDVTNITEDETVISLQDGNNITIPAGKWSFNIDIAKSTMVVTRIYDPHAITVDSGIENGTVTIKDNKTTAKAGEVITIIATPANGYELGTVTVMAGETAVEVTEDYTFVMPDAAVVVSATFVEKLEAMFNFDEDYATLFPTLEGGTSSSSSTAGDITELLTATVDGVNLTVSPKTSGNINNRIWSASPRLRVYSGTITVEAPEGCILTQIDFTNHSSNFNLTPNTGEISGSEGTRTWTGEASTVIFTIVSNTQIKTMNVSYAEIPADQVLAPIIEGVTPFFPTTQVTMTCETVGAEIHYTLDGSEPTAESTLYESPITLSAQATVKAIAVKDGNISTIASKEFVMMTNVATIAEYKELAAGTEFGFTGNVTVTYVNGRYLYVKDETGSALIYGDTGTEFEFTQGQVLAPNWTAKTKNYNGLLEAETPANLVATNETVEVVPAEMQLNAISTENENEYIIVKNVAIGEPDNKNFTITDADENTITGRTNFTNVTHPTDFTVNYDITCVVAEYNGTVQLYPTDYKVHVDPVLLEGVVFAEGRNWATWYGDANLALPEGVTAYVVTGISGDKATVEPLSYIPANVGVLLYSETADETVEAMPYEPDAPATITGNLLVGVAQAQEVSNAYVLYNNAFILIQDGTQVAAHRCYLQAGGNAAGAPRVLRIAAAGTVTGIDALVTDGNSGVKYYDLSGRYVGTSLNGKRGIFITSDGKKVVR